MLCSSDKACSNASWKSSVKDPEILPQIVFQNSVFQLDSKEYVSISADFVARTFYIWNGGRGGGIIGPQNHARILLVCIMWIMLNEERS